MLNYFHNFNPNSILISIGFLKIYWYGFFIVLGSLIALLIILFLSKKYKIEKDIIIDLFFYLFIFGVIGARIYDVFLEWRYYVKNPIDVFKIWQGGLAIHGAILSGIIVLIVFIKKVKIKSLEKFSFFEKFFKILSILVPGLVFAQFIGRWGNYFNQELFGRPTNLPWGIFIDPINRPLLYSSYSYFHPTFLYESLGCLLIFLILVFIHLNIIKKNKTNFKNSFLIVAIYFIFYSILRFFLEFIRIDFAPIIGGWRWPQIISVLIVVFFVFLTFKINNKKYKFYA